MSEANMQLHQLQPKYKHKIKKRVGRGGKRGTYSGRGIKGQKARAGRRIRPAERDLILKLPKLPSFKKKRFKIKPIVINLNNLEKKVKEDIINRETLLRSGLIKKSDKLIKILGNNEIKRRLTIEGLEVSENAKKKIEAVGGRVIH